jgi:hypothetical protein
VSRLSSAGRSTRPTITTNAPTLRLVRVGSHGAPYVAEVITQDWSLTPSPN